MWNWCARSAKARGLRAASLEIRYKGKNIHEVLQLTVQEAVGFFRETPRLVSKLQVLVDVGLGYSAAGPIGDHAFGRRSAAREAGVAAGSDASSSGTLFLFDEPTTGLHFDDIAKLSGGFERLIENGGSLLIIEHNMDVIRAADWVIDMGPEGGEGGGELVAAGRVEDVAREPRSHTGHYLRN